MKQIRLAQKIIKTLIKDKLHYPGRLVTDTLITLARFLILMLLYWYVFNLNNNNINGTSFIFVCWSMFFYFSFFLLRTRNIARQIMNDVKTGTIEVIFSKPIHYLFYRFCWQLGDGLYPYLLISSVFVIGLGLTVGFPSTFSTPIFLLTFLLTIILGAFISLCIYGIIGLLSFWIEDIDPIYWIIDKMVMILGGSYLPIALFPDFLYQISIYSPFGASQFITHSVYPNWQINWPYLLSIQFIWLIICGLMIYFIFQKAKSKISINGG
jgi:ABC-2 type transport system permease protein